MASKTVFIMVLYTLKVQITKKLNIQVVTQQKQNRKLKPKTRMIKMTMVMMRRVWTVSILLPLVSLSMEMFVRYATVEKRFVLKHFL